MPRFRSLVLSARARRPGFAVCIWCRLHTCRCLPCLQSNALSGEKALQQRQYRSFSALGQLSGRLPPIWFMMESSWGSQIRQERFCAMVDVQYTGLCVFGLRRAFSADKRQATRSLSKTLFTLSSNSVDLA